MAKNYDFSLIYKLLGELEQSADRIHKISSDFQSRVKHPCDRKAA